MACARLSLREIEKAFGENRVLRGLSLELQAGEIHALVGGNGAGKSTLSKIIAGLEALDAGKMHLDGEPWAALSRRAAQSGGVVMVLQELNVLPTLSVAENLFLAELPARCGMIGRSQLAEAAAAALRRVGLDDLDPEMSAGQLGVGQQQLLEIAGALIHPCRVLILDEPTAALSGAEVAVLFRLLRELRGGGTAILYISHRLEEIAQIADRVSVLRDGQLVGTHDARAVSREELIQLMAGSALRGGGAAPAAADRGGAELLRVAGLCVGDVVRGASFAVKAGEIVGLGGLVGAGRTELLRALYGADRRSGGEVWLGGAAQPFLPRGPKDAVKSGVAFVSEDRRHQGLFGPLSIRENATMAALSCFASRGGWIDATAERTGIEALIERLQVRCAGSEQPIAQLSGGNQQKIVIGRWLLRDVRLWLLDEPTRGVDMAARRAIYSLLREFAAQGAGVLVASSDYEELAELCDRVLVLSCGRITGEFTSAMLTPEAFMAAAFAGFSGTGPLS